MTKAEKMVCLGFAVAASLIGAILGWGYHWCKYHNNVTHDGMSHLPGGTRLVVAVGPWVFLIPVLLLVAGILLRRTRLPLLVVINLGWVFAFAWPATCLWAWELPFVLL